MISYLGKTFCTATGCAKAGNCERALTDAIRDNAERWWGGPGAPIATSEAETMRCFVPVKQEAKL
jgi:hypothetical protein